MYILAEGKGKTRLFGGLCEVLVTDREVTDMEDV
jgi:hypothetical protein